MDSTAIQIAPQAGWRALLRPAVLDRTEQVAVLVLWLWFAWRITQAANPFAPLALLSETAVLVFVLIRRPTQAISVGLGDWMLAITATLAPLLIAPGEPLLAQLVPLGVALVFFGNCFQAWAKLVLRRSFGIAPANRGVKISGPYKFVRHPMYAGYLLVHIGLLSLMPSAFNLLVYGIAWWAQVLRLKAEERLLSEDAAYRGYLATVRWRLIPGIF
jgi:protein-S-isoprenylcysteine O-methyltransferase Ste14